jgi:23S rRNA G2445 N2-methylase RlmL
MGRLGAVGDAEPELGRIAQKALAMLRRDGTRDEASGIDSDAHVAGELAVVFLCRGGLERIVAEEIEARIPSARDISPGAPGGGRVTARWRGRLAELLTVRTALEFGVALPVGRSGADHELCVRALASEEAKTAIAAWTTGSVRYRIQWAGQGHRRGATWSVVRAVGESEPSWVNDPTASTWEVRVDVHAAPPTALLVPRKLVDRRFAYRERDVPAASHPTLAAALVRASRPRANDVVWDPFVGSGTELIERAKVGPFAKLLGTDTDARALDVARANARAAEVPLSLERGDATRHRPPAVSAILTNPPMGRRVARDGSLADLLDAFVDHASTVLVADGRLVWLSPLGGRTAARAEARGLTVVLREPVDMGGFFAELQVFESRRRAY